MLEEPNRLRFNQLVDHATQNCPDGEESFVSMTDIRQTSLVQEDFLDDEYSNCFG